MWSSSYSCTIITKPSLFLVSLPYIICCKQTLPQNFSFSEEMETGKEDGKRIVESDEEGEEEEDDEDNKKRRAMTNPSGRKASGASGSSQISCQVENCPSDMTGAKTYYRRHKVCPFHAKAAVVLLVGTQKRFCQQCSRFHELSEFDEAKRSCRRRLAGHNERRRKSSYDSH